MKTNYVKCSLWLVAMLLATVAAKAQTSETAYDSGRYNSYDDIHSENGKQVEHIQTYMDNKAYKMELVNDKMTSLSVDGVKIAEADWGKYNDEIAAIREQIRKNKIQALKNQEQARLNQIQAKKNQEQALKNQEQARLNQIQEGKNQEQAVRNQEQAVRNQEQAVRNQEQTMHNQEQTVRNQERAVRDQEQSEKNQLQAKKDQEQALRNQEQAVRNQEQAAQNQLQAKKNQKQAEENQRFMKQLIDDLVSDKIIPDEKSLRDFTIDSDGMSVNGVKQPDAVFKKYIGKYERFEHSSMSYHDN